jgi:hypothetical protein
MRKILLLVLLLVSAFQVFGQSIEDSKPRRALRLHSVSLSANVLPSNRAGSERWIQHELPIGRFQPSISFYRENPSKWVEVSLLVFRPGLTESVLDTSTISSSFTGIPFLSGRAGSFKTFHAAMGISRGLILKPKIFGLHTTAEYGGLVGFRNQQYTNRTDIFPNALNFKSKMWYSGVKLGYGLSIFNRKKINLDLKLVAYCTLAWERRLLTAGTQYSTIFAIDLSLLPILSVRVPLR